MKNKETESVIYDKVVHITDTTIESMVDELPYENVDREIQFSFFDFDTFARSGINCFFRELHKSMLQIK